MKKLVLTLLITGSFTAIQAQISKRDTSNKAIVNTDLIGADSVKRGQEVYQPSSKQDTTSQKQKPKKKPTQHKEATKPRS